MRKLAYLLLLCALVACQNSVIDEVVSISEESAKSGNTFAKQVLVTKHSEWQVGKPASYSFVWKNSCFCMAEYRQAIKVRFSNGEIEQARYLESGLAVSAEVQESIKSIDEVFALLLKYVDKADTVSINYADLYPIPKNIFIDRDVQMADEEIQLSLSEFTEL